jgi:Ca2+-binding EF-hand superfamily protein
MAAFSELQKNKLIHMFELLDIDGNGIIEYEDFRMVVDTLADERGWGRTNRRYIGLVAANRRLWKMYTRDFDANGDGTVSLVEWMAFHIKAFLTEPLKNGFDPSVSRALNTVARFFCDMLDSDLDGEVTEQDYVEFCEAYHIDEEEARRGFRLFDRNQNGILQQQEVAYLIEEFYLSDDPDAPGNQFFGCL